jgi:hypothetical protein
VAGGSIYNGHEVHAFGALRIQLERFLDAGLRLQELPASQMLDRGGMKFLEAHCCTEISIDRLGFLLDDLTFGMCHWNSTSSQAQSLGDSLLTRNKS